MKQRIYTILAVLVCYAVGYADNITVESISLKPGETKELKISLSSAVKEKVGIQFDVTLPEGFSLENNSDSKVYQLSSNQANDLSCYVSDLGNRVSRFVLYSSSLQKLKEGELMSLNLKAADNMDLGSYSISISNVALSDDNGQVTKDTGTTSNVKVTNFFTLLYKVDGEDYQSYEVEYGAAITPEADPTKEGYTFSGWSEIPETMPAHDVTVTGTFCINKYKLTYMIDDKVYKETVYEYGAAITPEPKPEGDYATFEWKDLPQTMPAHDVVVYASYTSGIAEILMNTQRSIRIYSTDGEKLDKPQKGLNIVIFDDGTIKKIVVK